MLMKKHTKMKLYSAAAGCAAGTLLWELLQVILRAAGLDINLTAGPAGIDISVISLYIRINPGTIAGGIAAWIISGKI